MNSFHSLASQVCQSFAMQNTVFKPHGKKAYARVILVGPSGLEPPTSCLSGTRSNLLSYDPMWYLAEVVLITWLTLWWRWWVFQQFRYANLYASQAMLNPWVLFYPSSSLWSQKTPMESFDSMVEMMGFEPMTPCLQGRCSPSWATPPLGGRTKWTRTTDLVLIRHAL